MQNNKKLFILVIISFLISMIVFRKAYLTLEVSCLAADLILLFNF